MKVKKVNMVKDADFNRIYDKKPKQKKESWEKEFSGVIEHFDNYTIANSLWYIGDFYTSKIVAVGGDCDNSSPLSKKRMAWPRTNGDRQAISSFRCFKNASLYRICFRFSGT